MLQLLLIAPSSIQREDQAQRHSCHKALCAEDGAVKEICLLLYLISAWLIRCNLELVNLNHFMEL